MTCRYELRDTFNDCHLSWHRSLEASIKARKAHSRSIREHNGANSYLTYAILEEGELVDGDEMNETEEQLWAQGF